LIRCATIISEGILLHDLGCVNEGRYSHGIVLGDVGLDVSVA
jgi:hypothetical protein